MSAISGWIAYALVWILAATVWSLAAAAGAGRTPIETLPYGLWTMGLGASMGLGVWWLTGRLPLGRAAPRLVLAHCAGLLLYASVYATAFVWPEALRRDLGSAVLAVRRSPVLVWNLLMGGWLYLAVAGGSYAVRAHRRARAEAATAADARSAAQQAQLAALRAQVNPHFLFNALHSVGSLVKSDPDAADEALERLGDLLRYALADEDEVALSREWSFTTDYLAFEQLRLGKRLRLTLDLDPAAAHVQVPALVLQPFVENSVRHGIAPRPEGGALSVSARVSGQQLILRVVDDGPGAADGPSAKTGIGTRSVERRLRARYGSLARVTVETENGAGYSVTVSLPVQGGRESSRR